MSGSLLIHNEPQDTNCHAWKRLLDLVEQAAEDGREEFDPRKCLSPEDWVKIVTLPPTISKLKSVKKLMLYGSNLVRIPPEIGEMTALEEFVPYTSNHLHWFPYEIIRCQNLKDSTVSTRVLYGNYKFRPPFPQLPDSFSEITPSSCSVCNGPFSLFGPRQIWISLRVATDVLPLLVHACSSDCIRALPTPPEGYISKPHRGGTAQEQPPPKY